MLDEKDLQAIQSIIADAEQRITKNTVMMMETKFEKRFNLLAEGMIFCPTFMEFSFS